MMLDREKVIKGLIKCRRCKCDDCTEKGASKAPWDCPAYDNFIDSAIVMLKEMESVVPLFNDQMKHFVCSNCSLVLDDWQDDYCRSCDKRIAWDEYYIHKDET